MRGCEVLWDDIVQANRVQAIVEDATGQPCPCLQGRECPLLPGDVTLVAGPPRVVDARAS